MRKYIATNLHFFLILLVVLPVLLAYGVSGVGYVVILLCMCAIHISGRYTEYLDARFESLERERHDANA